MFKNIIKWLNKPFPFYETIWEKLIVPLYIALFIILFLFLFNPSKNTDNLNIQLFKMFSYALITFIIASFYNIALPLFFQRFFDIDSWNIWKTIVFSLVKVTIIGIANAVYAVYFDSPTNNIFFPVFLLKVIYYTLIIASIPVLILIFWLEKRFYKKHYQVALVADQKLHSLNMENTRNEFFEHNDFKIDLSSLYYIKSDGNYCTFYFEKDNAICKTFIRITLKEIEDKIESHNNFIRCHKSYIVNYQKVGKVEGNARRYNLYIDKVNVAIPVSRSLSKSLVNGFGPIQQN